jgi:hypothetical protein
VIADDRYRRPANGSSTPERGPDGKLLPGNALGRKGRPKGALGFSRRIRRETRGGRDLVKYALAIARDPNHKDCLRAVEFLADRAFGKPREMTALEEAENLDRRVSLMSVAEAKRLM